jgi:hypothetical protein
MTATERKLTPEERKARQKIACAKYHAKPENKARSVEYYAKNKARIKARNATPENKAREKTRRAKPEIKTRIKASQVKYDAKPENRARQIATKVGTPIEIPNRPRPFDNRCECCGEISTRTLHFDHCHDSGRFRGWCCHRCNSGAGLADNPKRLRLRARYLERPFQPEPIKWAYPHVQGRAATVPGANIHKRGTDQVEIKLGVHTEEITINGKVQP